MAGGAMKFEIDQEIEKIESDLLKLEQNKLFIESQILGKQAVLEYLKSKTIYSSSSASALNNVTSENATRQITLVERIDKFLSTLNEEEFTCNFVYDGLLLTDEYFDKETSKTSISNALAKFAKQGKIKITFKGGGRAPSRYKLNVTDGRCISNEIKHE